MAKKKVKREVTEQTSLFVCLFCIKLTKDTCQIWQ